jgi:hypothetical protein
MATAAMGFRWLTSMPQFTRVYRVHPNLRDDLSRRDCAVERANVKAHRRDRRGSGNQMNEPYVVVWVRERDGNSVPAVFNSKSQAASFGRASCTNGMVVHADEATWDQSHERFEIKRIDRQAA